MSSEQIRKRRANEAALLRELHFSGMLQRGELSEQLGMRKSSVSNIVAEFVERGVLTEDRPGAMRSRVSLEGTRYRSLVGHVEPNVLRLAEVTFDGTVHGEERTEVADGFRPGEVLGAMGKLIVERMGRMESGDMIGVGVALPGITDPGRGLGIHAVNMRGWENVNAGEMLSEAVGMGVGVENDVRCQLMGNAWFRPELQAFENLLYVSLQKGVACSAMVGGLPLMGTRFAAGEIGCLRAGDEGKKCACGKEDCLQTYVSAPAILESVREELPGTEVGSLGELAAEMGADAAVAEVVDRVVAPLIPILAASASILDPEAVLLASDDVGFSEQLRPLVERRLNRELMGQYMKGVSVLVAENAEDATLRGMASALIRNAFENGVATVGG